MSFFDQTLNTLFLKAFSNWIFLSSKLDYTKMDFQNLDSSSELMYFLDQAVNIFLFKPFFQIEFSFFQNWIIPQWILQKKKQVLS